MLGKKREIFIKLHNTKDIANLMKDIKKEEEALKKLFDNYDKLNAQEIQLFENWNNHLEDVVQKLDHVSL